MIAAIDGYCLAGGFELAIQSDIRVASRKSVFGLPEARRSILAGPGLTQLPRMIPLAEALRIALTGAPISAERAYQIGVIQEVAADRDEVMKVAQGIAEEILLGAPLAMQEIKRLVKEGVEMTIPQAEMLREILSAQAGADRGCAGRATGVRREAGAELEDAVTGGRTGPCGDRRPDRRVP